LHYFQLRVWEHHKLTQQGPGQFQDKWSRNGQISGHCEFQDISEQSIKFQEFPEFQDSAQACLIFQKEFTFLFMSFLFRTASVLFYSKKLLLVYADASEASTRRCSVVYLGRIALTVSCPHSSD